jgi:hypothetical protein
VNLRNRLEDDASAGHLLVIGDMIVFTDDLVESVICVRELVQFLALSVLCVGLNLAFDPIHVLLALLSPSLGPLAVRINGSGNVALFMQRRPAGE